MQNNRRLLLASKSPRRKQLLSQLGIQAIVIDVDINEVQQDSELPINYVSRVAEQKAIAAFSLVHSVCNDTNDQQVKISDADLILAADTCIVFEKRLIGKPRNAKHAGDILRQLSGCKHQVLSAVCLLEIKGSGDYCLRTRVNSTEVELKQLSETEISDYWQTGEPIDKAGGYAIQGLAATFIKSIHGSYSAVMGLPLYETTELLADCGINLLNTAD